MPVPTRVCRVALAGVAVMVTVAIGGGDAAAVLPPGSGDSTAYSVASEGPSGPQPQQVAEDAVSGTRYIRNTDPSFEGVTVVSPGGPVTTVRTEGEPVGLAVDPAARLLLVAEMLPGGGAVAAYRLDRDGSPLAAGTWSTTGTPVAVAAGDGRAYVVTTGPAELVVLDETDLAPETTTVLAGTPTAVAYDAADARVLVTTTLVLTGLLSAYDDNGALLNHLALAGTIPAEIVVDPASDTAVVLNGPTGSASAALTAVSLAGPLQLATTTVPLPDAVDAVVDPDRHLLYVALGDGELDVLSLPDLQLLQTVSLSGAKPSALAVLDCTACPSGRTRGSLDVTDAASDVLLGVRFGAAAAATGGLSAAPGTVASGAHAATATRSSAAERSGRHTRQTVVAAGHRATDPSSVTGHAAAATGGLGDAPDGSTGSGSTSGVGDPAGPRISSDDVKTAGASQAAADSEATGGNSSETRPVTAAAVHAGGLPAAVDFTLSLPSPAQTSTRAADLVRSSLLALLLLALLGLPVTLINRTTTAHAEELAAALLLVRRWLLLDRAEPHVERFPRAMVLGAGALGTAVLSALVEPNLGLNSSSLALVGGLLAAFLVTSTVESLVETGIMRRSYETGGVIRLLPGYALVALVSVSVSRLGHIQPGLLLGVLVVVQPLRALHEKQEGHAYAVAWVILGLIGTTAWFVRAPLLSALGSPGSAAAQAVGAGLTTVVAVAIEALAFAMVPLSFMPGLAVLRWSKPTWALLWAVGGFAFVHVLLAPEGAAANGESTRSLVVLLAAYLLAAAAYWGGFALHDARSGREAVPDEAEDSVQPIPELVSS